MYYIYSRQRLLNIHYILYFYGIYIMIHDDHNGLKMEKKVSDDSLLDNAPNYLVGCVIQKRYYIV